MTFDIHVLVVETEAVCQVKKLIMSIKSRSDIRVEDHSIASMVDNAAR